MKNLAIIVHDLSCSSEFSVEKLLFWLAPLKAERFGIIPVFEVNTLEQFSLMVNSYEIENAIISNSKLIEQLYSKDISEVQYQIHATSYLGKELKLLLAPNNEDVVWHLMEQSLDRFEELL